jgi:hypothetical protein
MRTSKTPAKKTALPLKDYGVFTAVSDLFKAVRNNPAQVALAVIMLVILNVLSQELISSTVGTDISNPRLNQAITGTTLVGIVAFAVLSIVHSIFTSIAVFDGAEKKTRALTDAINLSFLRVFRVAGAALLVWLVVLIPVIIGLFFGGLIVTSLNFNQSAPYLAIILPVMIVASVVFWVVFALLRYALVPLVAIFETDVPIRATLERSKLLMEKGGQWFLAKAFLLLILLSIFSFFVTGAGVMESTANEKSTSSLSMVLSAIIGVFFSGLFVMLYRNRLSIRRSFKVGKK